MNETQRSNEGLKRNSRESQKKNHAHRTHTHAPCRKLKGKSKKWHAICASETPSDTPNGQNAPSKVCCHQQAMSNGWAESERGERLRRTRTADRRWVSSTAHHITENAEPNETFGGIESVICSRCGVCPPRNWSQCVASALVFSLPLRRRLCARLGRRGGNV